ncbi:MAG: transglycosylase domain-containing protein [Bacteroidota bacterium]
MSDSLKAILSVIGVFLALILFHVLWPLQMKLEPNSHFISSVRDEDHNVLAIFGEKTILNNRLTQKELEKLNKKGELNKFPIIPVMSYQELPENYIYFLTKVESKNFFEFGKDNVYGMSFSGIARLFKGKADGGSNIPQQLLKNAIHKKDGIGTIYLSRKYGEQLAAFQMVKSASPEEILMAYTNYSGNFWYEQDFSGLIMASYAVFNRPPHELNDLEMLLTVKTLKGGYELKKLCSDRYANRDEIKERMLAYFGLIADGSEEDRQRLDAMKDLELGFSGGNRLRKTSALTNFFTGKRGNTKGYFALQYVSSISRDKQLKLQKAVDRFKKRFSSGLKRKGYNLEVSLLAIDIETGLIEATLGNREGNGAMANFTDYGSGFQCGSILKPLVFLELFENYDFDEETRLFNGDLKEYKYNPDNVGKKMRNKEVLVRDVLKYSLNKAAVNHRVHTDPLEVALKVESSLAEMDVQTNPSYSLGESYVLGTRTMTPWEVAQAYQMLFNEGRIIPLSPWKYIVNPHLQDTIFSYAAKKQKPLYSVKSSERIKALLPGAFEAGGTCHRLIPFLPDNKQYYGKTGTTGKAKDGWTVLSDGKKLIVAWAGYVKNENGMLSTKGAPEVPSKSGAGSAGILAAMAYAQLYN